MSRDHENQLIRELGENQPEPLREIPPISDWLPNTTITSPHSIENINTTTATPLRVVMAVVLEFETPAISTLDEVTLESSGRPQLRQTPSLIVEAITVLPH